MRTGRQNTYSELGVHFPSRTGFSHPTGDVISAGVAGDNQEEADPLDVHKVSQ